MTLNAWSIRCEFTSLTPTRLMRWPLAPKPDKNIRTCLIAMGTEDFLLVHPDIHVVA